MNRSIPLKVDEKGRISLPAGLRRHLGIKSGDIIFCQSADAGFICVKAINPLEDHERLTLSEKRKIAEGLADMKANRVCSLSEARKVLED